MYIKIKLETKNPSEKSSTQESTFIYLSDTANISDVKKKIEPHVKIDPDEQIIKDVTETFHDDQKLCDICDAEGNDGSALMLYDIEHNFVCFLQLYTDTEADQQRKFEQDAKRPSFYKNIPLSSTSTVVLLEDDYHEEGSSSESSESTTSSEKSDSSTESDSDTNKSKQNNNRKRVLKPEPNTEPAKKRLFSYHTELLSKYLEELPNYTESAISSTTPIDNVEPIFKKSEELTENANRNDGNTEISERTSLDSSATLTNKDDNTLPVFPLENKPCALIAPEMRKFIAVVSTNDSQEFLKICSIEFERSSSTACLQFDEKMPIVQHSDGNLWIACTDDYTLAWILNNIKSKANFSYSIRKLIQHFEYHAYSVVIPKFQAHNKSLHEQFQLLEHQNSDLNTGKWIVERQHMITDKNDEFFERNVSILCQNEVIFIQIDLESKKYLEKKNFQLNYCFWKIHFEATNK